jgi:DNA-binding FrmR family transcriptional regulator
MRSEEMTTHYNQWELINRLARTKGEMKGQRMLEEGGREEETGGG